ncbi:hypothetical protein ACUTQW_01490 [Serratia sp. TSA_7]|uniref:hypothetical protein n=1 Tax=Serratia sp. TSA_7 TaxID=3415659 RepID=UPI004046FCCD
MNNNDTETPQKKLFEKAKYLWKKNALTTDEFDSVMQKINRGDFDYAHNLLELIEHEHIRNVSNNNSDLSLDDLYKTKENQKRYIDGVSKRINNLEKTNTKLIITNENLKKTIEILAAENETIKENSNEIQKENLELKNKHQQNRIDEKIPDYVKDVSQKLDVADKFFSDMSRYWSIAGLILALCAVASAFCTFFYGLDTILDNQKLTPTVILYTFVRGGLGIALLSWVSYISFSNARNYTHESILRKDRQHALTFGRLFLQIYGSTASKEDAIHVFKDWNMSGDTAFSSKSSAPPSPLSYIDTIKNALSKASATTKSADKTNE